MQTALGRRYGRSAGHFDAAGIRRIKAMTARNDHTRAYIAGSKMLGLDALVSEFERIDEVQEREGYLPSNLSTERYALYEQMMAAAKQQLPPDDFKKFYRAF
jgi:hypothetical protein